MNHTNGSGAGLQVPEDGRVRVAVLVDEAATVIDFCGPWEAFQDARTADGQGFALYTVGPTRAPVRVSGFGVHRVYGAASQMGWGGFELVPEFDLDSAPAPNVVVMGAQSNHSPAKIEWIKMVAATADIVMSVCTGAFLLAKTGLLDGLSATTHHNFYERFENEFPAVDLRRGPRFVDNGKFITAGGITSGVDGALHVIDRYFGTDVARIASWEMEYTPADGELRAALGPAIR